MAGKYSVKETKELFDLGFALAGAGVQAMADGKVNFLDIGVVIPLFPLVGPAIDNAAVALSEVSELDEQDSVELLSYAKSKIPSFVDDEDVVKKVVVCVKAGLAVAEAIAALKGA